MITVTWIFLTIPLILASQEVLYMKRREGDAALLACVSEETNSRPIGMYLKRDCTRPTEVLFFSDSGPAMERPEDEGRIQVKGELGAFPVNVTLSRLQRQDSGTYYCEFMYAGEIAGRPDRAVRGRKDFFLFVETITSHEGRQCSCSNYPPLLYAISAAVLLLLILLAVSASRCGKSCKHSRPQNLVPIYEEMVGMQAASGKAYRAHLEDADAAMYVMSRDKHTQENHYENPRVKHPVAGVVAPKAGQ